MVTEIIIYELKKGMEQIYWQTFIEESLPLMKRWNIIVLKYGFALDNKNTFHLLRTYDSLDHRNSSQNDFYKSNDWRNGPRTKILECIENYSTTIFEND